LFKDAKEIAGKRPNTVITDGAANFHDAFKKEFYTLKDSKRDIFRTFDCRTTTIIIKWSA
jgi:hypothetical protein